MLPREEARREPEHDEQTAERHDAGAEIAVRREVDAGDERQQHAGEARPAPHRRVVVRRSWCGEDEQHAEDAQDREPEQHAVGVHAAEGPEHLVDRRAGERERAEQRPAHAAREQQQAEIEQQHVGEQPDRVVAAARCEDRRQESADEPDHRDHQRAVPPRQRAARGGDDDHQHEHRADRNQAVELAGCPERRVEDHQPAAGSARSPCRRSRGAGSTRRQRSPRRRRARP